MRVALGQFGPVPDKAANLATIGGMVAEARARDADLVVFPEYAMFKEAARTREFVDQAEPLDGPFAQALRSLARQHSLNLVAGLNERIPGGERAFNTLLLIGPDGADIGTYRKIHLYDAFGGRESDWLRPGDLDQQLVFDIGGLRVGVMTCYDVRFPEMARLLVDGGAQVILLPAAWTPGPRKEDHWSTLVRARAIENTVYVLAAGGAPPVSAGGSLIVDPMGVIVGELGEESGLLVGDVSPGRIMAVRSLNPALEHRRFTIGIPDRVEPRS